MDYIIVIILILGPMIGALIGVWKKPSLSWTHNMLSFAAGVMLAISFLQLIPETIEISSIWICVAGITIGSLIMYALDRMLPHIHPEMCSQEQGYNLKKTAMFLIVGISLHHLPEGMAIAIGSITHMELSLAIAFAIAIHDIPEGICTAAPYYHVTGKKMRSFLISSATSIPTLIGFMAARYLFKNIDMNTIGLITGATAGLMIYISGDELIPTSCNADTGHGSIFSLIAGVIFVIMLELAF